MHKGNLIQPQILEALGRAGHGSRTLSPIETILHY